MRRSGITRIEAVILFAIVGVLLGLTIPAFVSLCNVGETFRCQANVQQLAMAVHVYTDSHDGRLPALTDAQGRSWMFEILPFAGQGDLHKRYDPARPDAFRTEGGPASTRLPIFLCPSDTTEAGDAPGDGRFAPTNYAINGMAVGRNDATMKDTFRDGTSNTFLLAERVRNCAGVAPLWAWSADGPELPAFAYLPPEGGASSGMFSPDVPIRVDERDRVYGVIGAVSTKPGTITRRYAWQTRPTSDGCDPAIPQTPHARGMVTAMADGAVRTVTRKVSQRTFWEAVTPAGGEALGADR